MKHYALHDDSGRILQTGTVPDSMFELQGGDGLTRIECDGPEVSAASHYVVGDTVVTRPRMSLLLSGDSVTANGVDALTMSGTPTGAALTLNGPVHMDGVADGAPLEFSFALPGIYALRVELFPYQTEIVTIHAL